LTCNGSGVDPGFVLLRKEPPMSLCRIRYGALSVRPSAVPEVVGTDWEVVGDSAGADPLTNIEDDPETDVVDAPLAGAFVGVAVVVLATVMVMSGVGGLSVEDASEFRPMACTW
jgi:hypothetical protein